MENDRQLVFEKFLDKEIEALADPKPKPKKQPRKLTPKVRKKPKFAVYLTHEDGVDWRLECFQAEQSALEPAYYDHLASEALKLELLKLLKSDSPSVATVNMLALILTQLGAGVPIFLQVDQNKNLFEGDFWSDFETSEKANFKGTSISYLWAFYFKEFTKNEKLMARDFSEYPADETDLLFLVDAELVMHKYPGLKVFMKGL